MWKMNTLNIGKDYSLRKVDLSFNKMHRLFSYCQIVHFSLETLLIHTIFISHLPSPFVPFHHDHIRIILILFIDNFREVDESIDQRFVVFPRQSRSIFWIMKFPLLINIFCYISLLSESYPIFKFFTRYKTIFITVYFIDNYSKIGVYKSLIKLLCDSTYPNLLLLSSGGNSSNVLASSPKNAS